jgi:hypothetical protein
MKYRVVKYTNPQTGVSHFAIEEKVFGRWQQRTLFGLPLYHETEEIARNDIAKLNRQEINVNAPKLIKEILK